MSVESMDNGEHKKLYFECVDGEVFSKLFYLVDGIYLSISRFISSGPDPRTKIAYSFAADQEAQRKDVKRAFSELTHPINLHHCNDIYYLVLGAILQRNMMFEAHLENGEDKCAGMYKTAESTTEESGNLKCIDNVSAEKKWRN
eukprot:CCRYP_014274-RA/>CCRYP_014274-RA protein AED:0.51 eAED:0.23 QI:0/0/0/1/0/0/2/0/143